MSAATSATAPDREPDPSAAAPAPDPADATGGGSGDGAAKDSGADSSRLGALFVRVGRAVVRHRALVGMVLLTAALEAFFSKAPFTLVVVLIEAADLRAAPIWEAPPAELSGFKDWFLVSFGALSEWICNGLGIEFAGETASRMRAILTCAILAGTAGVLGGVAIYFATLTSRLFAARIVVDLRNEIAQHLLQLPMRFYGKRRMGELISNMTNDTAVLSRSFSLAADHVAADPFHILFNALILAVAYPPALIVFVVLIPAMALPIVRLGKKVHRRSRSSLAAMGEATESMNQMLTGIRTVKAYQLEGRRLQEFRDSNETYVDRVRRTLQAKGRSQGTTFISYQLAFAALVFLFGWALLTEQLTIEDLGWTLFPLATTYTHVKRLARTYNNLMESLGALDRIESILHERTDPEHGRPVASIEGRVGMEGVSFAYDDELVLSDVSFDVAPGTTVALVGPSGAGKTTCLDLLARFHDPVSGRVLIDGQDLRELDLSSYREFVAVVDQHPFLFNTTVYENIACGLPGATSAQVEAAARAAHAHEFIQALPLGYDTVVGERGSALSGGQQQRITIARAILRDPRILFLDEATSALDSESELAVQIALNNLMVGRTSFVIAHRLSTIRDADLILVLEAGRLVESGTHDELARRESGLYQRLLSRQQMK